MKSETTENNFCDCLLFSVNTLSRVVTKLADEQYATIGLSPSHAYLMQLINNEEGICPRDLSKKMELTPSTITRLLEKLFQKGYIEKKVDGRHSYISATASGKSILPKIDACTAKLHSTFEGVLGEEQSKQLTQMVYRASQKLQ